MLLKYYYSIFGNLLFLIFGLLLLGMGLDLLFLNLFIKLNAAPPTFALWIMTPLGFLIFSSSLANLLKGKDYVLTADNKGITIFTKSISNNLPEIFINWSDIQDVTIETIKSFFRDTQGGHRSVLKIKIKPNLIQWPPVMITKNRIGFKKYGSYDEISIDAWLNKNKNKIAKELNEIKKATFNIDSN